MIETVIVIAILGFIMTVIYQFFGFLYRESRLELTSEGYLKSGSRTQINQQMVLNSINRFFLSIGREVRSARSIQEFSESWQIEIETIDDENILYSLNSDYHVILRNDKPVVENVKTLEFTVDNNRLEIALALYPFEKSSQTESDRYFTTAVTRRNPD